LTFSEIIYIIIIERGNKNNKEEIKCTESDGKNLTRKIN